MKKHCSTWIKKGIVLSCLLLSVASVNAQITVKVQGKTVRQVLRQIEREAGYSVFYNDKLEGLNKRVTLSVSNEDIRQVLSNLLSDTDITYRIDSGKQIVLGPRQKKSAEASDKKLVKGKVTDMKGEPLIGVSVSIDGTNEGTVTDVNGYYQLAVDKGRQVRYCWFSR